MTETVDDRNRRQAQEAAQALNLARKQSITEEANTLKEAVDRTHALVNSTEYYSFSPTQQGLLTAQYQHMKGYLQTLQTRLRDWEK